MLKIIISYLCACSNFNAVMQRRKEGGGSCNYASVRMRKRGIQ